MAQKLFKISLFYILLCSVFQVDLKANEQLPAATTAIGKASIFRGPRGHKGHHGHRGHHGKRGNKGKKGTDGTEGATGSVGAIGSVGATGALGLADPPDGLICGDVSGPVGQDVVGTVTFATTVFAITGGVTFSGGTTFTIPESGDYRISYAIAGSFPFSGVSTFTVLINGVAATPDSRVTVIPNSPPDYTFTFERIYTLSKGDTIQVRQVVGFAVGAEPVLTTGNFLVIKVGP